MSKNVNVSEKKILEVKDLINVGIFSALYFVLYALTSCIGFVPIFMILVPVVCPIITGIPLMLYMAKIKKFGMLTITGIIVGAIMFVMGHPWFVLLTGTVCGFAADVVLKLGEYKSKKMSVISYGIFSMWSMGAIISLFFGFKENYLESYRAGYGDTYVDTLYKITPDWLFWVLVIGAFVGGIIGGMLGIAVLKKHFKKAGIV